MEHIFSLCVIGVVVVGLSALFMVGESVMWLLDKLFPKAFDKMLEWFCR